jgi:hypothetical protein
VSLFPQTAFIRRRKELLMSIWPRLAVLALCCFVAPAFVAFDLTSNGYPESWFAGFSDPVYAAGFSSGNLTSTETMIGPVDDGDLRPARSAPNSMVLYDDFNSRRLDPAKWFGGGGSDPTLDVVRRTNEGRLRLLNRAYAGTDSDSASRFGIVFVGFTQPSAITSVQTTVRISGSAVEGCSTNPTSGVTAAQIFGTFFNAGTPAPNSHLNDVAVAIDIARQSDSTDPKDVFQINAAVLLCQTTADCSEVTVLNAHNLGSVARKAPVTIRVQWQPDSDRFVFQRDSEPEVFSPYLVSDTFPPGFANKLLGAYNVVPNCTTERRPTGSMDVTFDNVYVNQSAAPGMPDEDG